MNRKHATPFLGLETMIPNVLLSYYYYKTKKITEIFRDCGVSEYNVLVDSGAFTVYTLGKEININDYADWVFENKAINYVNLDALGNAEETLRNQKKLEEIGLNPIPVFHQSEDFKYLDYYLDNYGYLCISGSVDSRQQVVSKWMDKCFDKIYCKNITPKIHGLGIASQHLIKRFPFYSVDSSSWKSGVRFGVIKIFNPDTGIIVGTNITDRLFFENEFELFKKHYLINSIEFYNNIMEDHIGHSDILTMIGAKSHILLCEYYNNIFGRVFDGTHMYLADARPSSYGYLISGCRAFDEIEYKPNKQRDFRNHESLQLELGF